MGNSKLSSSQQQQQQQFIGRLLDEKLHVFTTKAAVPPPLNYEL